MSVTFGSVVRWLVLGLVIIVGGLLLGIAMMAMQDLPWLPSRRWVSLAVWTIFVFGVVIYEFRPERLKPRFWAFVLGLLVAHVAVYVLLLRRIENLHTISFFFLSFAESVSICGLLSWRGFRQRVFPRQRKRRKVV